MSWEFGDPDASRWKKGRVFAFSQRPMLLSKSARAKVLGTFARLWIIDAVVTTYN